MRSFLGRVGAAALLAGCSASDLADAGTPLLDAPAGFDVPMNDAGRDAASSDVRRDAPVARRDAGLDVGPAIDGALELFCGVRARALCTVPWTCRCETSEEPPIVPASCEAEERTACEAVQRDALTIAFERYEATFDEAALDRCVELAHQSYAWCLPNPVTQADQPASCWDAFVVGAPLGAFCDPSGVRCAGGAGVCIDRICQPVGAAIGAPCSTTCTPGLACVDGACAEPVAAGGACGDHEDCAGSEFCVGGRCAPPVTEGGACDGTGRCAVNARCEDGACRGARVQVCPNDGADTCASGDGCRRLPVATCQLPLPAGAACENTNDCERDMWCDRRAGTPGVCTPFPREGEACSVAGTIDCLDDRVCAAETVSSSGTCQPRRGLGERCDDLRPVSGDGLCVGGLGCFDGTCGELRGEGELCPEAWECQFGLLCVPDTITGPQRCRRPLAEGEECGITATPCAELLFCDSSSARWICRAPTIDPGPCGVPCDPGEVCSYLSERRSWACLPLSPLGQPCGEACEEGLACLIDPALGRCVQEICERLPASYRGL